MPKTKLGRWAGLFAALFVVLLLVVLNQRNLFGWKIGSPGLIVLGISWITSGIAAFVTGIISLIKFKDRSPIVILAVVIGFLAALIVIMEAVEAITWRGAP